MPIAINGSGTVTGVSVGGLPDGIVDTDMLAASAVTDAKTNLTGAIKAWIKFNGRAFPGLKSILLFELIRTSPTTTEVGAKIYVFVPSSYSSNAR